jgi:hypothetical protein
MATFAFTDADVNIDSTDLSDHVRQVALTVSFDELDDTAMGDTYRSRLGGLGDWNVTIEFNQDFAASEVDATIWPLIGTVVTLVVKPTSGSVSATNPSYSGSVLISDYTPMSNSVGDLATVSVTWPGAGTLTRATS